MTEGRDCLTIKEKVAFLYGDEWELLHESAQGQSKIRVRHRMCGFEWEGGLRYFLSGITCRHCSPKKRTSRPREGAHARFVQRVETLTQGDYQVLSDYQNNKTKLKMRHVSCGMEWDVLPLNFLSGSRCPRCSKSARKSNSTFEWEVGQLTNHQYQVLEPYYSAKTKVLLRHKGCGYEWRVTPNSFLRGVRCPRCCKLARRNTEQFKQEVWELTQGEYRVLGEYESALTKISMRHVACGHEWKVRPNTFLRGSRCPYCSKKKMKTTAEFAEKVLQQVGIEYEVTGTYQAPRVKLLMRHVTCGHEWDVTPHDFLKEARCPYCTKKDEIR